jgi:hypothetical protein
MLRNMASSGLSWRMPNTSCGHVVLSRDASLRRTDTRCGPRGRACHAPPPDANQSSSSDRSRCRTGRGAAEVSTDPQLAVAPRRYALGGGSRLGPHGSRARLALARPFGDVALGADAQEVPRDPLGAEGGWLGGIAPAWVARSEASQARLPVLWWRARTAIPSRSGRCLAFGGQAAWSICDERIRSRFRAS